MKKLIILYVCVVILCAVTHVLWAPKKKKGVVKEQHYEPHGFGDRYDG